MDPGTSKTLWWVYGFSASDVYAVGAAGVVTHFDGTRWTVEREGGDFTLFGAWGATPDDLVAVGGVVTSSSPRPAMVSRRSGWTELSTAGLPANRSLFKVWGTSAAISSWWASGAWWRVASPGRFTAADGARRRSGSPPCTARAARCTRWAGCRAPVMLRFDGTSWRAVTISGTPQFLNGVAVNDAGAVLVVGLNGYLAEGRADTFEEHTPLTRRGLHGAAVTRDGFVAVGGELLGAFGQGVLLARGKLEAGPLKTWPSQGIRFDAGVDAGSDAGTDAGADDAGLDDAGVEDAGTDGGNVGPGESCDGDPMSCQPGLACWFVFGPFKSFCAATCTSVSDCGAYGPGACCQLPGPQVTIPVCLPRDAGVCDAGP